MKPEDIATVEKRLNYTFKDKNLLIRSLTRKAFAQEQKQQGKTCEDQEVYRILGDAVLKAILVEMLIQQGYDSRESITNKKIDLEKRENLGKMFEGIGIAPFIRFGVGEKKQKFPANHQFWEKHLRRWLQQFILMLEAMKKRRNSLLTFLVNQGWKVPRI
jgi:ribonuclease-3